MRERMIVLPTVALRGMVILPGMVAHFDIGRPQSIKAVEHAMIHDQEIFLIAQKDLEEDEPTQGGLYRIGTLALVKQVVKMQKDAVRVLVEGVERAELMMLFHHGEHLEAELAVLSLESHDGPAPEIEDAMLRSLKEVMGQYAAVNPRPGKDIARQFDQVYHLNLLIDGLAAHLPLAYTAKQELLEAIYPEERYECLMGILLNEINIFKIKNEIQAKIKEKLDKNQKEYILREQLKIIRQELGEDNAQSEIDHFLEAVGELEADESVKEKLEKEIARYKNIGNNSSESGVIRGYIETLLELPWDKESKDNKDIRRAEEILEEDHYGLEKVKERMLEFLAVRNLTEKSDTPIICLVGPPGTGKTSVARSVARALEKKYVRISLGGVRDEAEIRGHRKTYVGAMPGRLVNALKYAGVKNPLILLDEVDKLSRDYKGDTASALLEVLDSEQNHKFRDHYVELPIDLSEVLFITTANTTQTIPRPLLDRMELIEVSSYTENEKNHIARGHLIEKQLEKHGLKGSSLSISDRALKKMIRGYTKESGVRSLERKIGELCRKAAREIYSDGKERIRVTQANLEKFLGKEKYRFDSANEIDEVGIVRGLAWTSVGGDTLQIEVNIMPGKGELSLTGQMGDVMKESARAGISYIRSISESYGIDKAFFKENDIHIHIPEGAVPKDGPSAGITMATAMLSAVTGRKVKASVAMTGEITLRGRVLSVGGLKEKILAAKNAGVATICVPKKNEADIAEIQAEIKKGIEIIFVEAMEDVLKVALAS